MPIIKSAIKKMRHDKKVTVLNKAAKENLKVLIKNMRRTPSVQALQKLTSALDKAAKTHLIHTNKASRLKSRLQKLIPVKPAAKTPSKQAVPA